MTFAKLLSTGLIASAALASGSVLAANDTLMNGKSAYGQPSTEAQASRVVNLGTQNKLNVRCGDTVTFVNGGKTFTWKFDVATHRPVDLAKIAPAGFAAGSQTVYVSPGEDERAG